VTRAPDFITLTFGLTSGWWLYEDPEVRSEHSPVVAVEQWRKLLTEPDWRTPEFLGASEEAGEGSIQTLIIAERGNALDDRDHQPLEALE
jgi:hypothetical protein